MNAASFRDAEQLSAYLDGQLSGADRTRLEARLKTDPALASLLDDLRQTREALRRTPRRRAPRNFILTPKMAGLRPPVTRLVPALSWASAAAALLFLFTLGSNLIGQVAMSAAAPKLAAAPVSQNNGQADNTRSAYGIGGGPVATEAPAATTEAMPTQKLVDTTAVTATPEISVMSVPEPAPTGETGAAAVPPAANQPLRPFNFWPYLWLGLALVLILAAALIYWLNLRAFRRKNKPG